MAGDKIDTSASGTEQEVKGEPALDTNNTAIKAKAEEPQSHPVPEEEKQAMTESDEKAEEKAMEEDTVNEARRDNSRKDDPPELFLQPKLSFTDFIPPPAHPSRNAFTQLRPHEPVVVQRIDPSDPKNHYQITWDPTHQNHQQGFSPYPPYPYPGSPPPTHQYGGSQDGATSYVYAPYPMYYPQHYPSGYPLHGAGTHHPGAYSSYAPHHGYQPQPLYSVHPGAPPLSRPTPEPTDSFPVDEKKEAHEKGESSSIHLPTDTVDIIPKSASEGSGTGTPNEDEVSEPRPNTAGMSQASPISAACQQLASYVQPTNLSLPVVLERKERKNQQSRRRANLKKQRMDEIQAKPPHDRSEEELALLNEYLQTRERKNNRSKERALEKKLEAERILAKPAKQRTNIEAAFLEQYAQAKKRKNEGDRLRRERMKKLGITKTNQTGKPGVSARGPVPPAIGGPTYLPVKAPSMSPGKLHYSPVNPYYGGHSGYSPYAPYYTPPPPPPPVQSLASWDKVEPSFEQSPLPSLSRDLSPRPPTLSPPPPLPLLSKKSKTQASLVEEDDHDPLLEV